MTASGMRSRARSMALGITIRLEVEGDRVQAVALARRPGTVIEEMAEVAAAPGARDLGAPHPEAPILVKLDRSPSDRLEEAGPARARFVFRLGTEQLCSTGRTSVDSAVLGEEVLPCEGALRPLLSEHLELLRRQPAAPFLLGAGELPLRLRPALVSLVHQPSFHSVSQSGVHGQEASSRARCLPCRNDLLSSLRRGGWRR